VYHIRKKKSHKATRMIEWFENLPEQCPPKDAFVPNGITVYRFAFSEESSENDFISQRMLFPNKEFVGVDECTARSLSVLNDLDACKNKLKLPRNRKRFKSILEVNLRDGDGLIKQTFKDINHYSWWRSNSFNFANAKKIV